MSKSLLAALALMMTLTACGAVRDSRLNPFNWFGRDRSEPTTVQEARTVQDRRPLVDQVLSLNVDPTPEGAIIRVIGVPLTQGYWDAELVRAPSDDPTLLAYEFRLIPPLDPSPQGTQRSREIVVGTDISTAELRGIRQIIVIGQRNRRAVSR